MTMQRKGTILANAIAAFVALATLGLVAPQVSAAAPRFKVRALVLTSAEPNDYFPMIVKVENVSNETAKGPITVSDTVSPGFAPPKQYRSRSEFITSISPYYEKGEEMTYPPGHCETAGLTVTCTIEGALPPRATVFFYLETEIETGASGPLHNVIVASGDGGTSAPAEFETVTGPPLPFAINHLEGSLLDGLEAPLTQAGAVPAEAVTDTAFPTTVEHYLRLVPTIDATEQVKDITVHLPAGMIGNPTAVPTCPMQLLAQTEFGSTVAACPMDTQVGIVHLAFGPGTAVAPLYNLPAPPGSAAELGFQFAHVVIVLNTSLRPGDHGIDVVSPNTSTTLPLDDVEVIAWGDPVSATHDRQRAACVDSHNFFALGNNGLTCPLSLLEKKSFLRMPTSCSGQPLRFEGEANTYGKKDEYVRASFNGPVVTGCNEVPFSPTIFTQPTATAADSPTGVAVQLGLPQNENPEGLAEGDLKKAVVTLPEGMVLNPSSADGLQACDDAHLKLGSNEPSTCPDASKVGTVTLKTQLLENPIEGSVWLRTQNSSDPMSGEMFRMAIELRDDRHGIDIKLPGGVQANPVTGRLTSTFDNAPQLPFQSMTLHFKSGARAPLTTPFSCMPETTEADLYPWARPNTPVHKRMTFELTSGPEGSPCQASRPFNPSFNAGVSSVQAGGFTPFLATFSRKDVDQSMEKVSVKMPKGLLGSLVGLPLCPEAQANAGTCSPESEIGTMTAGAGDGPTPFYVTGGHVYMTGPYKGAPFGLSVVVPAKAGPFDLGLVVVRAKVEVDVHTAQLTVTTDPLPQIVGGVPVNLRLVNVTVNRPNFTYNPTDCEPSEVSGTITGGKGAVADVSDHFQVTNCGALGFKPKFSVSTSGKTSRKDGASLDAKLSYPRGPQGTQANIAKVKVSLPKQLPSRLKTLQKACPAETFEANPAACPEASRIGMATASTPVLPVPLNGPVYFVSHGGEAFPDLVVVLQGYGVTIDLVGNTFIKNGITSTTFNQVPDVPVGSFELKLPQGPDSALAANGNLCASSLKMPTIFTGQDGQEIRTSTPIVATGCSRKAHHKHKHHKHHKKHKKK